MEILGGNLIDFFNNIKDDFNDDEFKCTYHGKYYEVWEVSENVFQYMNDMSEEEFTEIIGEESCAWWRYSTGSVLGRPCEVNLINGLDLLSWTKEDGIKRFYSSLTEYLCNCVGASQPKNVCALAVDLARYNGLTLGELFTKYEG